MAEGILSPRLFSKINNSLYTKQDKSTAITTSNIGNQTVANSNKCNGFSPTQSSTTINDGLMVRNKDLSNGNYARLTSIGYDGVNPYVVIDGTKHHFNIID